MEYQPHQLRVIEEEAQLADRLTKLSEFFKSDFYNNSLPIEDQLRMRRQQSAMADYLAILQDRIQAFQRPVREETLAGKLYTVYCKAVGGVAFNGDPLPEWGEFSTDPAKKKQADAWRAVAKAAQ